MKGARVVVGVALALLLSLVAPAKVGSPLGVLPAAASSDSDVVASWKDGKRNEILLRRGMRDKLVNKHGLTVRTVTRATQLVNRVNDGGARFKYEATARQWTCRTLPWPQCEVLREQVVRVVVETAPHFADKSRQMGVVTAYCPQNPKKNLCPSWVNDHLN